MKKIGNYVIIKQSELTEIKVDAYIKGKEQQKKIEEMKKFADLIFDIFKNIDEKIDKKTKNKHLEKTLSPKKSNKNIKKTPAKRR